MNHNRRNLWKIIPLLLFMFTAVALREPAHLGVALLAALTLAAAAGVTPRFAIRRLRVSAVVVLAVAVAAVPSGSGRAGVVIVLRFLTVAGVSMALLRTAAPGSLSSTMTRAGFPAQLVDMVMLTGRYIRVISGEFATMKRAMCLRGGSALSVGGIGNLAGTVLVRANDRSERVYAAMHTRGYGTGMHRPDLPLPACSLEARRLVFSYPGESQVIRELSLRVEPGERVALLGANGSGKTTFFLLAAGVLRPVSGEVLISGNPVRAGKHNPEVGMLFQDPDDQLFCPTVLSDVAFGPGNTGLSPEEAGGIAANVLEQMNLGHLSEKAPHNLSAGEKRMASLAGVMAMNPGLLLLDEPESSLDHRSKQLLTERINTWPGTAIIASHDLGFLKTTCTRGVVLDEGVIAGDGPLPEIMAQAGFRDRFGEPA